MNDTQRLKKMRDAHIPSYALSTNFDLTGRATLRSRVTSKEVIDATSPVNFYLYTDGDYRPKMRDTVVAVGLVAKALVLQDKRVIHCNLAGLLREIRVAAMEREARVHNPVLDHIGRGGYVAIPDFLEFADVEAKYGYHAVQLVADHLVEHVERGGGLILGAYSIPLVEATQYGSVFAALLQDNFEAYRIG